MFPVFETIALVDGQPQHPEWHQWRYEHTFLSLYKHKPAHHITENIQIPAAYCQGLHRMKISYNEQERSVAFAHYETKTIQTLKIIEDNKIRYNLKYTDRTRLDALFAQRGECDDILIVQNGLITDTSYCNIVFHDGKQWITPTTPLLPGTCRERLLSTGIICATPISIDNLYQMQKFVLINALRGFQESTARPVHDCIV